MERKTRCWTVSIVVFKTVQILRITVELMPPLLKRRKTRTIVKIYCEELHPDGLSLIEISLRAAVAAALPALPIS